MELGAGKGLLSQVLNGALGSLHGDAAARDTCHVLALGLPCHIHLTGGRRRSGLGGGGGAIALSPCWEFACVGGGRQKQQHRWDGVWAASLVSVACTSALVW